MTNLVQLQRQSLSYLKAQPSIDGAIFGYASSQPHNFSQAHVQQSPFFSALILECLHHVTNTELIRDQLATFLCTQASPSWSWNYWVRTSLASRQQPYPDDLDDTACALVALYHYKPDLVNGTVLGAMAQHLVSNETATSGPYETWLIDRQQHPNWQNIDLAVNANIGYFLSLQGVTVPGIMTYIEQALVTSEALRSTYYVGELPLIYFLSRWYHGEQWQILRNKVRFYIDQWEKLDALQLALLISSACRLNFASNEIAPLISALVDAAEAGVWPAHAFYDEPLEQGVAYYAGSKALTTALALESLSLFATVQAQPILQDNTLPSVSDSLQSSLWQLGHNMPNTELRTNYQLFMTKMAAHDTDQQITGMASLTARACASKIAPAPLQALNLASLHGWVAYTIYDNIWDGEPEPELLGVANLALRQTVLHFNQALPKATAFQRYVQDVLTIVDAANTWEYSMARASVQDGQLTIAQLPDYSNYHQLAERSFGHLLAAAGTLHLAGYALGSREQQALRRFFQHFLIARQLNDDAHDWEDDLGRGQLSSVVCLLLQDSGLELTRAIHLAAELEGLRLTFWNTTIDTVHQLVRRHCRMARRALSACPFAYTEQYAGWVSQLEAAAELAISERDESQNFILSYRGLSR